MTPVWGECFIKPAYGVVLELRQPPASGGQVVGAEYTWPSSIRNLFRKS